MIEEFRQRREVIVSGLNKIDGISCKKPQATFYVFPNVKGLNIDSRKLPDFLLNNAGVAALSGTAFGVRKLHSKHRESLDSNGRSASDPLNIFPISRLAYRPAYTAKDLTRQRTI